jgi:hypothetical protein
MSEQRQPLSPETIAVLDKYADALIPITMEAVGRDEGGELAMEMVLTAAKLTASLSNIQPEAFAHLAKVALVNAREEWAEHLSEREASALLKRIAE